jgi:autotransporter-associated beta strand protein
MRDIRIWDTARTAAQIQAGMTLGSITGAQTGLVACYPTGLTGESYLKDTSGNGRDLVQMGETQFVENGIYFPGSNTHSSTEISGTLETNTALALGSGSLEMYTGTLRYTGTGTETTSRILWGDNSATGTFDVVDSRANLIFNATGGTYNQAFVKTGAGTFTYSNANTQQLTGAVSVLGGKLSIGGSANRIYGGSLNVNNATVEVVTSGDEQTIRGNIFLNGGTLSAANGVTADANYGHFNLENTGTKISVTGDTTSTIAATLHMGGWHDIDVANGASVIDLDVTGMLNHQPGVLWGMVRKYGEGTMRVRAGGNNTAGTEIRGGEVIFGAGGLGQGVSGQAYKVAFYSSSGATTLSWDAGNTEDVSLGTSAGAYLEDGAVATLNTGANNVTLSSAFNLGASQTGAITKKGSGTLTIGGANSYKGNTTILEGTLATSGANKISDSSAVVLGGGTVFRIGGDETVRKLSGTGDVQLQANMLGFGDSSNETLSGTFSGSGGRITKYGTGTVTLTGNNTFDGGVVFSGGILSASSLLANRITSSRCRLVSS